MIKFSTATVIAWILFAAFPCPAIAAVVIPEYQPRLPFTTVFKGKEKFDRLVSQAIRENWRALPIGGAGTGAPTAWRGCAGQMRFS